VRTGLKLRQRRAGREGSRIRSKLSSALARASCRCFSWSSFDYVLNRNLDKWFSRPTTTILSNL
jgi:nitrogen fixation/metabolism regulation signal transduction histidine kinase